YNSRARVADEKTEICGRCGIRLRKKDCNYTFGVTMCQSCYTEEKAKREKERCVKCDKWIEGAKHIMPNGRIMCSDCYKKEGMGRMGARICARCGQKSKTYFATPENKLICSKCVSKGYIPKEGETTTIRKLKDLITSIIRSKG
ncbi:hypothetical protein HY570_00530, partial [Candidatus Micrarchaeota archaeon]|nr:hypothetical protein [Candidatus Micrarchaeota archaeon]